MTFIFECCNTAVTINFVTGYTALIKQVKYSLPLSHQALADCWIIGFKVIRGFFGVFVGEMCMGLNYDKVLSV